MSQCVFPGSFDPPTIGHFDLIRRAAAIFDEVVVTVMINRNKKGLIPFEERVAMLKELCRDMPGVTVDTWSGLLAEYMRQRPGSVLIRGVRNEQDFQYEMLSAAVNRQLYPGMETLFFPAGDSVSHVSSSVVKEIAAFGGDYGMFIPAEIKDSIQKWLSKKED